MQSVFATALKSAKITQSINEKKTCVEPVGKTFTCEPVFPREERQTFWTNLFGHDPDENDQSVDPPGAVHTAQHEQQPTEVTGLDYLGLASNFIRDLGAVGKIPVSDRLIKEIEGLLALTITIQGCQDYVSICAAILLYARNFFDSSITNQIRTYLCDLFEISPQDGEETTHVAPSWLQIMRDARNNWGMCKDNQLFDNFSKLLGLMVTLGMCNVASCTFSIREFKVFEPDMKIVHGSALEIIDAMFSTVTFFVETMYASFQTKSLKPFIVSDTEAMKLDEEYSLVQSYWVLVKSGNLYKVVGIEDQEFDNRLEALLSNMKRVMKSAKGLEKKLLNDKVSKLIVLKNDYITFKIASGIRKAPFALEFFGESAQGKTTCSDQMIDALLASAGLDTSKEARATINPNDRYQSNWTTNKLVMIIDDLGNSKADHVDSPPTQAVIDVCNNQMYYANKAELDEKGKVFIEPAIVSVTTNVKHLDAGVYSNCPYSVQRRMHAVITVTAKKEFQYTLDGKPQGIDPAKITAFKKTLDHQPIFDDIWELTIEKAVCPAKMRYVATYQPVVWRGRQMVKVPFAVAQRYLIEKFHEHRESQQNLIDSLDLRKNIQLCPHDGCHNIHSYCPAHDHMYEDMEKQFGDEIIESATKATDMVVNKVRKDLFGIDRLVEGATSLALLTSARLFVSHWDWMKIIPTPWVHNDKFQKCMMMGDAKRLKRNYVGQTCLNWGLGMGLLGIFHRNTRKAHHTGWLALGLASVCLARQKLMVQIVTNNYRKELLDRNIVHDSIKTWRDEHAGTVIRAAGIVGALVALAKLYCRWRRLNPQGSLEPATQSDIDERDAEENPWIGMVKRPLPVSKVSFCTPNEHFNAKIRKNLVYATVVVGNRKLMANCVFLRTQLVVLPYHYFESETLDVTFHKANPEKSGGHFCARLCQSASYRIPNTDLCLCYCSSGGSFGNLSEWLPSENMPHHEFLMLWRGKDGKITEAKGLARPRVISNGICDFIGGTYDTLSMNTFQGLCGAPIISQGKASCISGIHLGGKTGTTRGCYGLITLSDMVDAMTYLRSVEGVIFSGDAHDFDKQNLGVEILNDNPMSIKSPLRYLPKDSQIEYYGSCPGATTNRTDVRITPISANIITVTGYPNIYNGPKFSPQYHGWQSNLANIAVPAHPFPHKLLARAIVDYKSTLLPLYRSALWSGARPLTEHQNMVGIPGLKFMDGIKLSTAIGFPLMGPKRKYVEESVDEDGNRQVIFDEVIRDEITRCLECYKKGERANTIAKACKKDEILSKEKCRIFFSNPIALTFLLRKYFLPIMRVMQMNPLKSECAVGINSHGPEWQQMHEHVYRFGKDRLFGGDYGKYDQKLPSQLIFAAFRILIDFARECDYTEEDISVMEAMTADVVFAYIAYNGDLIGLLEGAHISGNSITVIVNGLCGSLNLRAYFYSDPNHWDEDFRRNVSLLTYGDDNIGSVCKITENFTIKGASLFLEKYGQTYTMPDKESELEDFLPPEDFEFLKRKSVYCPKKGVHVGALVDKSIFKMLHMYMRPRGAVNTPEYACALNIDTALREWANHGESIYEMRRLQMRQVASMSGIEHLCTQLYVTYDESVLDWKIKYLGEDHSNDRGYHQIGSDDSFDCQN